MSVAHEEALLAALEPEAFDWTLASRVKVLNVVFPVYLDEQQAAGAVAEGLAIGPAFRGLVDLLEVDVAVWMIFRGLVGPLAVDLAV